MKKNEQKNFDYYKEKPNYNKYEEEVKKIDKTKNRLDNKYSLFLSRNNV